MQLSFSLLQDRTSESDITALPHPLQDIYSQRTDFERGGAGGNGVVCDGGVAARENDVRLAGNGRGAVGCGWDGEGETSVDGGCAVGWINANSAERRVCVCA